MAIDSIAIRPCPACGVPIPNARHRYCSRACFVAQQTIPRRLCPICDRPVSKTTATYCSRTCFAVARSRSNTHHFERPCEGCGKIIVHDTASKSARYRFCSLDCYWEWGRAHPETQPRWRGGKTLCKCRVCGIEFTAHANEERQYCSPACHYKEFGPKVSGLKLTWWKDGIKGRWAIAKLAMTYLGKECAICGWSETRCDAHHIVPVADGGSHGLTNVIVLCPNHHRMADRRLIAGDDLRARWRARYGELEIPPELH